MDVPETTFEVALLLTVGVLSLGHALSAPVLVLGGYLALLVVCCWAAVRIARAQADYLRD